VGGFGLATERDLCHRVSASSPTSRVGVSASQFYEQQDDGAPAVADATQDSTQTVQESCPADDCDSERASYEIMPKPGGSYEVRLFTCVECGHKWRES